MVVALLVVASVLSGIACFALARPFDAHWYGLFFGLVFGLFGVLVILGVTWAEKHRNPSAEAEGSLHVSDLAR